MTLAQTMAAYAAGYKMDKDSPAGRAAKDNFLDTLGCIMAGTTTRQFKLAAKYAAQYAGFKEAVVLGAEVMTEAGHAALAHAIAAHACDYDDMCVYLNGHSSALIVPVVLALGERLEKTAENVLEAYMTGVEIAAGFGSMFNEDNYPGAWNQTTALGIMGAVAAAGKMLKLSPAELTHAFGIGIGESSGNKANFGTAAKDLTVGMTALKAIKCAEFAKLGFTANPAVIEGNNGFFQAIGSEISGRPLADRLSSGESVFVRPGLVIKPYPTCRGNHNVLDILLELIRRHGLTPAEIREVDCRVQSTVMDTERYPWPKSGAEGKFSIAYCGALCLLNGRLDIMDFQRQDITDPLVLAQMAKVKVTLDPEIKQARFGARVTIKTVSGAAFQGSGDYAGGDPLNPLSREAVQKKFTGNAALIMTAAEAKQLSDRLFHRDDWLNERHLLKQIEKISREKILS